MMTVFGLFRSYEDARTAVDKLMEAGAEIEEINVLVQSNVAKGAMDINLGRAGVAVTDKVGDVELHGLDRVVAGQQPVPLPDLGDVYAAGEIATFVATVAQEPREDDRGLEPALQEFGLTANTAAIYHAGIADAGWLVFVRTTNGKAKRLMPVMKAHTDEATTVTG